MISFRNIFNCKVFGLTNVRFYKKTNISSLHRKNVRHRRKNLISNVAPNELDSDSVFQDFEGDEFLSPQVDFLENVYDESIGLVKSHEKKIRRGIMKSTFIKQPKSPNMLTTNEREHIIYLHETDPEEWTPETLSESFPALPEVIEKILAKKWVPENEKVMKERDAKVLENWEKFKRNELEAPPRLLKHLSKFIDKRSNLKIQLQNPKFFYLPEIKKEETLSSGPLSNLITHYIEEIEKMKNEQLLLNSGINKGENNVLKVDDQEKTTEKAIAEEKSKGNIIQQQDSLTKATKKFKGKMTTLDNLKESVFTKAKKVDNLSKEDMNLIYKSLWQDDEKYKPLEENLENNPEVSKQRDSSTDRYNACNNHDREDIERETNLFGETFSYKRKNSKVIRRGRIDMIHDQEGPDSEVSDEVKHTQFKSLTKHSQLIHILHDTKEKKQDPNECQDALQKSFKNEKKKPVDVKYYNTEKDKLHYEEEENMLSETCFWKEKKEIQRNRSKDSGLGLLDLISPDDQIVSRSQRTDKSVVPPDPEYPLKINIPQNQKIAGKLYKVKDCYYDDQGHFLYRVPGMSE